jgi:hypothetical protein
MFPLFLEGKQCYDMTYPWRDGNTAAFFMILVIQKHRVMDLLKINLLF